jgi:myo-inositol catabolism protein IolC
MTPDIANMLAALKDLDDNPAALKAMDELQPIVAGLFKQEHSIDISRLTHAQQFWIGLKVMIEMAKAEQRAIADQTGAAQVPIEALRELAAESAKEIRAWHSRAMREVRELVDDQLKATSEAAQRGRWADEPGWPYGRRH